jgi:hypothetical protein
VAAHLLREALAPADLACGLQSLPEGQVDVDEAQPLAILNSDALTPLSRAKSWRMSSSIPVYVAGFERLEVLTAD